MEKAKSPEAKEETIKRVHEVYERVQNRKIDRDYFYEYLEEDMKVIGNDTMLP